MRVFPLLALLLSLLTGNIAYASVVMTGTRVIFPENTREKTVQLKNMDSTPYIVQLQLEGGESATGDLSQFVITPQIFRMEPNAGQSIRIINSGGIHLPQDRESLFYLSFTQLPAMNKNDASTNKLVIAITNKVKVFYRPKSIAGDLDVTLIANGLKLQSTSNGIQITNPDSHYLSVRHASLIINNKEMMLATNTMIAPGATTSWTAAALPGSLKGARLRLVLVNDFGVDVRVERRF
ncbi:fimbrial biogenesis chaperone [[Enterobacter] lignolyticus]|uniref:Pili assembly chaperone, N-terminal protein n=1 Tax=Enterobacter lignolyticus (strain SCF1) TaxID=701347 RepID=E3GA59_ENTLS|nr:molecular chaperone [[Enterobacter] lignolyticus]ADO46506.1 Pili assembly chaperone, N-terminal protein [[Enterobacter] lignolyticus SCF1]